jgi:phage recombination protein Bet
MAENKALAENKGDLVRVGDTVITKGQYEVIVHTIAPGLDNLELELFFFECKRRGVHPMDRMIFPIKRNDNSEGNAGGGKKLTFQCSIDYFRAASEDTKKYLGQKPVEYGPEIPLDKACKSGAGHADIMVPESATVTLLRKGESGDAIEVPATVFWREFYPGEKMGFMWRAKPHLMLAKCAEAQAHRKAFPRELGGLYANEEVEKVDTDIPFAKSSTVREAQRAGTPTLPPSGSQKASTESAIPSSESGAEEGSLPGFAVVLPSDVAAMPEVKQKLFIEAMTQAQNNIDEAEALVIKCSEFKGTNSNKMNSISIFELGKASDAWCGKTLAKMRDLKK